MCGIYMITNKVNDKKYIGQAKDIYHRHSTHKCELNANRHVNRHLQGAWNKYGSDSFEFSVLEECREEELDEKEMYYIELYDSYNNGYNLDKGGQGVRGFKHTDEEINKMRHVQNPLVILQFDKNFNLIYRFDGGASHAKKQFGYTKECIERCCKHQGKTIEYKNCYWVYEEEYNHKDFSWEMYLNQKSCCEIKKNNVIKTCRRICQYTKDRKLVKIWESFKEIEDAGFIRNQVNTICNRRKGKKTHRGFIWTYEDYDWSDNYFDNLDDAYTESIEKRKIPVIQIDFYGNCINKFSSRKEAANYVGVKPSNISKAIKDHSVCMGYFWSDDCCDPFFNDKQKLKEIVEKSVKNIKTPVNKLDSCGNILFTYNSRTDAAKDVGASVGNISRAIKEHRTCKGFYFE